MCHGIFVCTCSPCLRHWQHIGPPSQTYNHYMVFAIGDPANFITVNKLIKNMDTKEEVDLHYY